MTALALRLSKLVVFGYLGGWPCCEHSFNCIETGTYRVELGTREADSTCTEAWTEGWTLEFEVRSHSGNGGEDCSCCSAAEFQLTSFPEGRLRNRTTGGGYYWGGTDPFGVGMRELHGVPRGDCVGTLEFELAGDCEYGVGPSGHNQLGWTTDVAVDCGGEVTHCFEHFRVNLESLTR